MMKDKEVHEVSFGLDAKTEELSPTQEMTTRVKQLEEVVSAQIEIIRTMQKQIYLIQRKQDEQAWANMFNRAISLSKGENQPFRNDDDTEGYIEGVCTTTKRPCLVCTSNLKMDITKAINT